MEKSTERTKEYATCTLPNGLRVVQAPSSSEVCYCGFVIDAGTRDEKETEPGMAHFVEHLLFKGTTHRRAWHILNRMERVGGDLNAFTNKEETTIYSTFLPADFRRAAELLCDIVFHSTFPENEIEKEREVIIDEIHSYLDSPAEQIFDDFEEILFRPHPLGRNILGNADALRTYMSEQASLFTRRYYRPDNALFFLRGNIPLSRIQTTLQHLTQDLPQKPAIPYAAERKAPTDYTPQQIVQHRDTHQAHVLIGTRAYHAYDKKRTALYLLNNILGGPGMNSRLNVSLRERRGLVYGVESNLTSYTDAGIFSIYFGCDTDDADHCTELVLRELRQMREKALSSSQLAAAQKQIIGQIAIATDSNENMAMDLGKSFLHYNQFEPLSALYERIRSLTPRNLLEVANEIFDESRLSRLEYR